MSNAVLERYLSERQEQITFIDQTLERVEAEGRDLVPAEIANMDAARQRIQELNAQIAPIEAHEELKRAHEQTAGALPRPAGRTSIVQVGGDRAPEYRSAGQFLVDLIRARGIHSDPDPAAAQRIHADPGGRRPENVGHAGDPADPDRRPGRQPDRRQPAADHQPGRGDGVGRDPRLDVHPPEDQPAHAVGVQSGEKTQLPSQKMTVSAVSFTKATYGGTVDISRQDIDWTSPGAWDILVRDLANVYAIQTETAVAAAFKTAATHAAVAVATNTLADWTKALYLAAADSYANAFTMPDRIWCSLDVWAALGSLVDVSRVVFAPDPAPDSLEIGASTLASFRGDILGLPRIVVPTFPAGTCIVGPSALFEVYEEVIGLLSVIEPSILGVQVAYGGYVAFGSLAGAAFVPLTVPAGLVVPSMTDVTAPDPDADNGDNGGAKKAAK